MCFTRSSLPFVVFLAVACTPSSENGTNPIVGGDSNGGDSNRTPAPAPYDTLTFDVPEDILVATAEAAPGFQGILLRGDDGTLFYAYLKDTGVSSPTCDIAVFGGGTAPSPQYEVWLAILPPGGAWAFERVPTEQASADVPYVTTLEGLDGTLNSTGNVVLSFAAGEAGLFTCGSSDLVVATRTGANAWNLVTRAASSADCCGLCPDPACVNGTDVGPWSSIALAGTNLAVIYQDYHNAVDEDGTSWRGLEIWEQGLGISGVRPWANKGNLSDLIYYTGASYTGLVAAYSKPAGGGLYVAMRPTRTGVYTDWIETEVLPPSRSSDPPPNQGYQLGERIRMAISPNGTLGLVAHVRNDADGALVNDLYYFQYNDTDEYWVGPEIIDDAIAQLGHFPSLAFTSDNHPVVAYYFCGAASNCGASSDGLRYAWRDDTGKWWVWNVHFDASTTTGQFAGLVLDPLTDEPTMVFQDRRVGGGNSRGAIMLTRGHFGP